MRYIALLVLVLVLVFVVAACGSSAPPIAANGTLTVEVNPLGGVEVSNAYPDITDGSQVTVTDSSGTVVGTGTLSYSKTQTDAEALVLGTAMGLGANADDLDLDVGVYTFTVTGLPGGEARYGIKVGQNRGTIWFTASQMKAGPSLTLGSLSS
jgi:hypothetical protein